MFSSLNSRVRVTSPDSKKFLEAGLGFLALLKSGMLNLQWSLWGILLGRHVSADLENFGNGTTVENACVLKNDWICNL